jgi:chemotaxis protein MotB
MSRRRKQTEHANHERWLVSYADFITLLFAFFVVMFSSSQVDKRKVGKLALSIQVAFQRLGMFTPTSSQPTLVEVHTPATPFADAQMIDAQIYSEDMGRIVPNASKRLAPVSFNQKPERIREELQQALADQLRSQQVGLRRTHEGLVISLREIGFYDSGSNALKPGASLLIARIARILLPHREFIRIEGHTDNRPIHNDLFKSNLELSTARATGLVELFIQDYGFPPSRLSAAGYAEFHPVATNDTAAGRALNRRVDIVILNPSVWDTPGGDAPVAPPEP